MSKDQIDVLFYIYAVRNNLAYVANILSYTRCSALLGEPRKGGQLAICEGLSAQEGPHMKKDKVTIHNLSIKNPPRMLHFVIPYTPQTY